MDQFMMKMKMPKRMFFYSCILTFLFSFAIFLPYFTEPLYSETHTELSLDSGHGFNVLEAFSGFRQGHWLPLARLLMHLQYLWFGLNAVGYKVVMFVFHVLISWLVIFFTKELTNRIEVAAGAGLIFAVHFCHWEIVVHTNMLHYFVMMVFYMLTLIVFLKYLRCHASMWLIATYAMFLLCLISSQTGVSLVAAMMGLDLAVNGFQSKRAMTCKAGLKYIPFVLLTVGHLVNSFLLNSSANSPHNPFVSTSVFSFRAPFLSNLAMYILELSVPIAGSRGHEYLRWLFIGIIAIVTVAILWKGSRTARFCVFWVFAAQFMFLFWVWPYPNSRYTYLSSIPFSILIPVVLLDGYQKIQGQQARLRAYRNAASAVVSFLVLVNTLAYLVSSRIVDSNLPGRNHVRLIRSFQNAVPSIGDGTKIYIAGVPAKSGPVYGPWAHPDSMTKVLSLYYRDRFEVKFVSVEQMAELARRSSENEKVILLQFRSAEFEKVGDGVRNIPK